MSNKPIVTSVKLDGRLRAAIARAARARGVTASEVIRDAVATSLDVCPTCGQTHHGARKSATRAA